MSHQVYEPTQPISHVYFPLTAVTSVLSEMEDGTTVEVATIGREGMVGLPVFLGDESTFLRCIAQIPGTALSMERENFETLSRRGRTVFRRSSCATPKPCFLSWRSSRHAIGPIIWKSGVRGGF
jgi:hypothetical protein